MPRNRAGHTVSMLFLVVAVLITAALAVGCLLLTRYLRQPRSDDHRGSRTAASQAQVQRDIAKHLGFHG